MEINADKPRFRGTSHQAAFFVAAGAGAVLLAAAPTPGAAAAVGVYVATLMALFGVSALYHRIPWGATGQAVMKRLDHSTIFLFIAGTYTPVCALAVGGDAGERLLTWVWLGAALGVARVMLWPRAPRAIAAGLYVLLGWVLVSDWAAVLATVGAARVGILLAGGLLYSLGALVYALQRPDPLPRSFGYHEVFHAFVIVGCLCHFAVIANVVLAL